MQSGSQKTTSSRMHPSASVEESRLREHCLLGIVVFSLFVMQAKLGGRGEASKLLPRDARDQVVGQAPHKSCDWLTLIRTTPLGAGRRGAQAHCVGSLGTLFGETMALNKNHSEGGGVIVNNTER